MNSVDRVNAVLTYKTPDRVPVAFHNYLQAAAQAGVTDFGAWLFDPHAMAEAHMALWKELGHDVIQVENSTCAMADALGCEVAYDKELPPHVIEPVIKDYRQLADMKPPDPFTTEPLKSLVRAVEILVNELGDQVYIQGRADQGPMALAISIMDSQVFLMDCIDPDKEEQVHALLHFCTRCIIRLCEAMKNVGANGTCIGGMGTSLISPAIWQKYERIYQEKYVQACRRIGLHSFTHTCGDETNIVPDIVATGCDALELDPRSNASDVANAARGKCAVLGMIDPVGALGEGTPEQVMDKAREMFEVFGTNTAFIVGAGCALPAYTPMENCRALVEAANRFGHFS